MWRRRLEGQRWGWRRAAGVWPVCRPILRPFGRPVRRPVPDRPPLLAGKPAHGGVFWVDQQRATCGRESVSVAEGDRGRGELRLLVELPQPLLDALAERLAVLVVERIERPGLSPWMDVSAAAAYLGFSRDRLYKLTAAAAIPCRRQPGGQRLLFHRDELDRWLESVWERQGWRG